MSNCFNCLNVGRLISFYQIKDSQSTGEVHNVPDDVWFPTLPHFHIAYQASYQPHLSYKRKHRVVGKENKSMEEVLILM
uniref:Uncharacterized protein n=1 Tax=Anguilla anguilla TaxID=7936 RepID=A0A0E9VQ59_ANGAN